jgi:molecular chaperone GrpE (heat shock protein)
MTEWEKFERMVNLKSDKVELGLAEDVKKAYADAILARKSANDEYMKIYTFIKDTLSKLSDAKKSSENALQVIDRFEKAAKDLGVEVPADVKNQKQNLQDGIKGTISQFTKRLESFR